MVNILIAYDCNYQNFIFPVINSLLLNTPEVTIYMVVTSDVTLRVVHPQIKYFKNDPQENFGSYSATKHLIRTKAPYNFIHGLDILFRKEGIERALISGVDTVHTKDLTPLFNCPVSKKGFAGFPTNAKILNMIKGFSNIPVTSTIVNKYKFLTAFSSGLAVIDLKIFHKCQGYQIITEYFNKYDTSEMTALNLYLEGEGYPHPKHWLTCHRSRRQDVSKLYSVDWRGARKPWNSKVNYMDLWNKYNFVPKKHS
jgi:lipopolysaccharide biosynthesis glycosyltransferase